MRYLIIALLIVTSLAACKKDDDSLVTCVADESSPLLKAAYTAEDTMLHYYDDEKRCTLRVWKSIYGGSSNSIAISYQPYGATVKSYEGAKLESAIKYYYRNNDMLLLDSTSYIGYNLSTGVEDAWSKGYYHWYKSRGLDSVVFKVVYKPDTSIYRYILKDGNKVRETHGNNTAYGSSFNFEYDYSKENTIKPRYPDGEFFHGVNPKTTYYAISNGSEVYRESYTYTYDDMGRIKTRRTNGSNIVTYEYY